MAKRTPKPQAAPKKEKSPAQLAVQAAGSITGRLIGELQNAQKSYLRIGQLLTEVREGKHYAVLHHEDMESYAAARLKLSPTSMYRYLKVYAWVLEHHPEWLEKGTKVRIPDLSDISGLIWIDSELARKDLDPSRRAELDALQKKAVAGELLQKELRAVKRRTSKPDKGNRALLAALRALRKRAASRKGTPPQVVALLDQAIGILENDLIVETAGLGIVDGLDLRNMTGFSSRNAMLV